eukprot:608982-Rhodomonas_salina.2
MVLITCWHQGPPPTYIAPVGASQATWPNLYKNLKRIDYCTEQFDYVRYIPAIALSRVFSMSLETERSLQETISKLEQPCHDALTLAVPAVHRAATASSASAPSQRARSSTEVPALIGCAIIQQSEPFSAFVHSSCRCWQGFKNIKHIRKNYRSSRRPSKVVSMDARV